MPDFKSKYEKTLQVDGITYHYYDIGQVAADYHVDISKFPYSIRVLLESLVRQCDGKSITKQHIEDLLNWEKTRSQKETPFKPMRVILQDLTGIASIVDLASMREAMNDLGGDVAKINPEIPVDMVIDHSVQVDFAGNEEAFEKNMQFEFKRNHERYQFAKWAQNTFDNFRVVPPATGIIHQVNIEYLSDVIMKKTSEDKTYAFPDTLVGTDSHTTMVNGLGVLGWGVGGIEAEAAMLGEVSYSPIPEVVGVHLKGTLKPPANATDLALTVTELLRKHGVVGQFVEFFGEGYKTLSLADRATLANMAPEYGATCGFFPIDEETVKYLRLTNRTEETVRLVEDYAKANHLYYDPLETPTYSRVIELDLSTVVTSLAGPKRPQDRIELPRVKEEFEKALTNPIGNHGFGLAETDLDRTVSINYKDEDIALSHGSVLIAAITSCTNTSNPYVLMAAGLLAKKAVEKGLRTKPFVKSSLAPGSKTVTGYLTDAGFIDHLNTLGFHVVGYGCTTCIGNSGNIDPYLEKVVNDNQIIGVSVLSGNRNFEGRIHPACKANYLASPPLVVAYAIAGKININWEKEPIGYDKTNNPVYLKDIWPAHDEVQEYVTKYVTSKLYSKSYAKVFTDNPAWQEIDVEESDLYPWDEKSTYIQNPPFFERMKLDAKKVEPLKGLRVLAKLGDSVTTDHISPAGAIPKSTPAGQYLIDHGVKIAEFNTYGSRRGNHEVMMRGTLANIRIRNQIANGKEGGFTKYWPTGEIMPIYDAAMKYKENNTGLVILAGKDYGMGSSRDWAAKGVKLLNVKAVIAKSFERIHRSNLIMMGVLPLEFADGHDTDSLGLTGEELFDIQIDEHTSLRDRVTVIATKPTGEKVEFAVIVRFDSQSDIEYYKNDGILPYVIRKKLHS